MRVLVVEDDRVLGTFLQKGLGMEGHDVDWVGDGEAALAYVQTRQPDLIVLDLGLPKLDGTDVLALVRRHFKNTSVLVLSGRSDLDERIRCLNLGAEDCVLKPFSLHELVARCTVILRRKQQTGDPVLRLGDLEMNRFDRTVRRGAREIELTAKEFALLEFLMLRPGQSCSRADLLREVWHMSADTTTNVVDVYVNYLRKKLGAARVDGVEDAAVIQTVRGTGYRVSLAPRPVRTMETPMLHPAIA
jgi:DNA-binding response OmpR family regulator